MYSLSGMVDSETTDLPVDYNPPVSTLFVCHNINRHRDLTVLATVEDGAMIQDLPSWTPDWSFGTAMHWYYLSGSVYFSEDSQIY